ncbi:MAG: hypothetical protein G01um101429_397 [Parcubacteria group bacterium Gr01-1014_29]|nr:MAG: hypothetical protein G01um101429_397 [Parcubacteria group bacterium Gr01-1014_29]
MFMNMVLIGSAVLNAAIFGGIGWLIGGPRWCAIVFAVAFFGSLFAFSLCQTASDDEPLLKSE